jgi:hypothetical protein
MSYKSEQLNIYVFDVMPFHYDNSENKINEREAADIFPEKV